ncbi:TetR/AcrR family transcriptional regulator [Falsigemmobacter faecalis]|uniref:TetR/AcrR family transcriptional regulator n=1 Tax=Falsigemmobacter faecalis TaxID=2488730 RepID=A0A3P3DPK1_9RHOB|nr:TetR/AcrR family transcriptional regulator [Falsigemmobacter faecalis]RRH76183.1 TetR/AcrR family transcriptional regulator [Falsigemmobacter faecalis]
MARTQSKDYSEIRENILRSAARLFAEKGFPMATIVDLAHACQSSRGALYHYFGSKEEILAEIISTHVGTMLRALEEVSEQRLAPQDHLRALARQIMYLNATHKNEQVVLLNDWSLLEPPVVADIAARQRKIVALIRDALTRVDVQHRMTSRTASTYAMSLLGSLNYTYIWFDPEGPVRSEDYADQVVDVFLNGFLAPGASG